MLDRNRLIGRLQWLILLLLFAYDGFTYLPEGNNVAMMKSVYYVLIFIAFLFIITLQMHEGKVKFRRIGTASFLVQLFIWIYFIRMYYDFMLAGVKQEIVTNPFAAVFLYANAAIVPFYGFAFFRWEEMDLRKLNTTILLIFLTMGLISLSYIVTGKALDYIGPDGRFMGNASMDTIAFGHLGTTITLMAIALFYQRNIRLWHKLLSAFAIVIGLFVSIAAGSRGALVALIICFIAFLYMNGHKVKILIGLPVLGGLFILLLPILNDILISFDNQALDRLYNSIYDPNSMDAGVTSGRDVLYQHAFENIMDNPFIGSSLFIQGKYVHNSVLEAFLGTGVFGGIIYLVLIGYMLIVAFRLAEKDKRYLFASLLFIQYFIYSLFSRTLSMLPLFWLSMYLVIYLNATENESVCDHTML
ncbi:MAG: O-antigen ligase family protein [Paludibacteraceae bacterium]|nr:O-antigen ligase family protein [Paludibacteraceae bacterium]